MIESSTGFDLSPWLAVSLIALSLCVAFASLALTMLQHKRMLAEQKGLHNHIAMMKTGVQSMGVRVLELENRLSTLRESQSELSQSTQDYAYSRARSLLDTGMSDDAIAETSGLTSSEIELMKLVHQRGAPSLSAPLNA